MLFFQGSFCSSLRIRAVSVSSRRVREGSEDKEVKEVKEVLIVLSCSFFP